MAKQTDRLEVLTGIVDQESKTYSFQKTVSIGGEKKTGAFVAKYMGIGARLRMGSLRAKLLDGAPNESVDTLTDDIAYMIAYLTVTLTKRPNWFNFEDLDDFSDLRELYQEVYNFTQNFRAKNEQSTNAGSSKDASGEETVEGVQRTAITTE